MIPSLLSYLTMYDPLVIVMSKQFESTGVNDYRQWLIFQMKCLLHNGSGAVRYFILKGRWSSNISDEPIIRKVLINENECS